MLKWKQNLIVLGGIVGIAASSIILVKQSHATEVDHDGRYIYYRTAFPRMTPERQKEIVDVSIQLMQNELKDRVSKITGIKTLSKMVLSQKEMDDLTGKAERSIDVSGHTHFTPHVKKLVKNLIPEAFMIHAGISGGEVTGIKAKLSGDLGFVVLPSRVIRFDTFDGSYKSYTEIQWAWVIVPHLFVGVGVGTPGITQSVGFSLIYGDLDKVSDFKGVMARFSAEWMAVAGVDINSGVVHNRTTGQNFFITTLEKNWGPEASASLDAEVALVLSLGEALDRAGTPQTGATKTLSDAGKTISDVVDGAVN